MCAYGGGGDGGGGGSVGNGCGDSGVDGGVGFCRGRNSDCCCGRNKS